jgi:hypothetical protein
MVERKSRHSDNDLIKAAQENATPSQQSSAGGNVNRDVGTRAELSRAADPEDTERALGSDNPREDAAKGGKTIAAIQQSRNDS